MTVQILRISAKPDPAQLARLREFRTLYEACFPDPDERETLEQWLDRLETPDAAPPRSRTHLLLALEGQSADDPGAAVIGGIVAEHYRRSCCGQFTYIAIAPSHRRVGLARRLLEAMAELLHREATLEGHPLRAIFAECEDPAQAVGQSDEQDRRKRLTILAQLGAHWVDLPYVQPALGDGKSRVHTLLLLAFPHLVNGDRSLIDRQLLKEFICEFYEDLGTAEPMSDPDVTGMLSSLEEGPVTLKELPASL